MPADAAGASWLSTARRHARHHRRAFGYVIAAAGFVAIAALTLTPIPGALPVVAPLFCLFCGELGGSDFLLNVLLFVPLGAGLHIAGVPLGRVLLLGAATTFAVESLQLRAIVGRDASLADLVSNTLGTVAGATLARRWRAIVFPSAPRAVRLAWWGGAAWLALAAATGASGMLWSPGDDWVYRRAAWGRRWGWFPGRIVAVSAGESTVTGHHGDGDGRYAVPTGVPVGGPLRMAATVVGGGATAGRAAIATVEGGARTTAALGQQRRELIFRVRTAASLARVRVPGLTIPDVFAPRDEGAGRRGRPVAGDTLQVAAAYVGRRLQLAVRWPGGGTELAATVHPFIGWSYLLPWDYAYGPEADALSALWAGGLIAPVAYWASRGRRPRRPAGLAAPLRAALPAVVPALVGLTVVPAAAGTGAAPAVVWAGVVVGVVVGAAGAAVARRGASGAADLTATARR